MLIIHEETCPALWKCCAFKYKTNAYSGVSCDGEDHAHDCHAPTAVQLEELVKAAEVVRRDLVRMGLEEWVSERRLYDAIAPFRPPASAAKEE
jgi:hypothetical protein